MLAVAQEELELDRGATSVAPGTERTCALTREVKPVSELIRFVVGPDGAVVPDVKRKLPGRGLWVTGTRSAIEQAVKRNVFARGFKREVRAAADLADTVDHLLERAALDALAVAAKAGLVAAGFAKVEAALNKGEALALIHASDAAAEGRRKLKTPDDSGVVVIDDFSGARLDLALSRPNVVHAALLAGPGSETFLARVARLVRYRQNNSLDRGR
jgi:predicted RNA-binding protein YlxR (DUF448 family)/ribosomal protein L30E